MKAGIWIDEDYDATSGGSFAYKSFLIKTIDNFSFDPRIEVCFVGFDLTGKSFNKETISLINAPGLLHIRIIRKLFNWIPAFNKRIHQIQNKLYKKALRSNGVKFIYYPIHMQCAIENFPFIATYWDIGHLSSPAFPEFVMDKNFHYRNLWFQEKLKNALAIFAETNAGKEELQKYLSIHEINRVKVMPIFPGALVTLNVSSEHQESYLNKFKLLKNEYFFYPAQFWAHKNHFNLIEAFELVLKKKSNVKLVLSGSDKGNLKYIKKIITEKGLCENIQITGFVSNEEIFTFYANAIALVMPTFLGPSNLPLLEAMYIGCPVICSDLAGHKELMKESALFINPVNRNDISDKMIYLLEGQNRKKYLSLLEIEKTSTDFKIENAVKAFQKNILELVPIRNCWE
jgi:glycosyltransferase involved in cell wall biosynthesis